MEKRSVTTIKPPGLWHRQLELYGVTLAKTNLLLTHLCDIIILFNLFNLGKSMGVCKVGTSSQTYRDTTERELTENKAHSDNHTTSHYMYLVFTDCKHNTTPLTLADTIETMTDSHTDNEFSLELVGTSRPSDSIETDREDSHQLYQHINTDHINTPPSRDNLGSEDTLDAPLADIQTAEVTICRGTDLKHIDLEAITSGT